MFSPTFLSTFQGIFGELPSADDWWDVAPGYCLAAYDPAIASDLAGSYINLVTPGTYDAYAGVAPSLSAGVGWAFSPTKYLKTGIVAAAGLSVYIQFVSNTSASRACLIGGSNGTTNSLSLESPAAAVTKTRFAHGKIGTTAAIEIVPNMTVGTLTITPTGIYINGKRAGDIFSNWTGETGKELYIGARNTNNTSVSFPLTGTVKKVAIYNTALSDAQVALLPGNGTIPAGTYTVFFGDSITAGTGASDAAHRWVNLVIAAKSYTPTQNAGISGTTLQNTIQNSRSTIGAATDDNGRDTVTARIMFYGPLRVFILYGLNDLNLNDVAFSADAFENDLTEVVSLLISYGVPAQNIIIGSPPYVRPTDYPLLTAPMNGGSTAKHQDYRDRCAAVATAKGTKYIDVYQWMIDNGGDTLLTTPAPDVHPNDAGHAAIANAFLSVA